MIQIEVSRKYGTVRMLSVPNILNAEELSKLLDDLTYAKKEIECPAQTTTITHADGTKTVEKEEIYR